MGAKTSKREKQFRFHGLTTGQIASVRRKLGETVEPYSVQFRGDLTVTSWCLVKHCETLAQAELVQREFRKRYKGSIEYTRIIKQEVVDIQGIGTEPP
jgi:hypothetical protein